jgi:hypothetical protein
MELHGLSPNTHIHVSVSYSYIPMISLPILLLDQSWEYINRSQIHDVDIGTVVAQFLFWEYRDGILVAVYILEHHCTSSTLNKFLNTL